MRAAWPTSLLAMLVLGACGFEAPGGVEPDDPGGGNGGGPGPAPCADDDADTVCNTADKCAGHDDRMDVDADGAPDGCDDWPCGAQKPADPGDSMSDSASERAWRANFINVGDSRRVVAAPGQRFSIGFSWGLWIDCDDGDSCRAQLEIGYDATRRGCIYDNNVSDEQWAIGGVIGGQFTAPTTPGVYELRLNGTPGSGCGTATSWTASNPGPESTIAFLCVP